MIRKEYLIQAVNTPEVIDHPNAQARQEIIELINRAFSLGAVVELKIIEAVDLNNHSKRFSKLRLDIISNTDFDQFHRYFGF